ncbi:tetratricopeptide repeat protein [bacterium]|nr:tetratricopeptide repeat protein [bacterium]
MTSAIGIPGFLLLYGTFAAAAWYSAPLIFAKREDPDRLVLAGFWAACAGYLAHLMFGLSVTGSTVFLWVGMAVVLAPLARVVEVKAASWSIAAAAVSLVVCAALLVGSTVYINADNHYLKARIFSQGDQRIAEAKRAIELNPYNDMYRAELALAYVDSAVTVISQLSSSGGTDAALREDAIARFKLAERELLDVIEYVPWEYDNYVFIANLYNMGAEYLDREYLDDALKWAEKGVEVEPYGPAIRFQLARALVPSGDTARALDEIAYAVQLDPAYADGWVLLGDIARQAGHTQNALEAYKKAIALKPALTAQLQGVMDSLTASSSVESTQ